MFYLVAADITVFIHLLWIVFLIFGALWGRKNSLIKKIHIGGMLFALIIQIAGWNCPLTHLEVWLRSMHDTSQSYAGSFIIHYMEKVVYINLPAETVFVMTSLLVFINGWVYLRIEAKRKK